MDRLGNVPKEGEQGERKTAKRNTYSSMVLFGGGASLGRGRGGSVECRAGFVNKAPSPSAKRSSRSKQHNATVRI